MFCIHFDQAVILKIFIVIIRVFLRKGHAAQAMKITKTNEQLTGPHYNEENLIVVISLLERTADRCRNCMYKL